MSIETGPRAQQKIVEARRQDLYRHEEDYVNFVNSAQPKTDLDYQTASTIAVYKERIKEIKRQVRRDLRGRFFLE